MEDMIFNFTIQKDLTNFKKNNKNGINIDNRKNNKMIFENLKNL